ncbi:MAG: hypothetical protein M0R32_06220 [Candidatus Cloacimonetes bacterium]|jgi:hypothetical protein|nr:hypothetical protein [Candidatus Cloacimonadota bacterium]
MSVIFPAGINSRISAATPLKKQAQTDFEEVIESPEEQEVEDVTGVEENPVSDIIEVEDPNPAFDAIRTLPGFEEDVAEIDALESGPSEVAEGDVAAAAAVIEDAALQIADAAKSLAGESVSEDASVLEDVSIGDDEVAVVEIPAGLEEPETEECEVCGEEIATPPGKGMGPGEGKGDGQGDGSGECCKDEEKSEDKDEEKSEDKDEPAEKVEKEGREASSKPQGFVAIAKLSPENKKFISNYWKDILGYPPEYVDAMVTDYEK